MTQLAPDHRLIRNPDLLAADMDGEKVMLSITNNSYYGINDVGARIWDLLDTPSTQQEISRIIAAEYDVEETQCLSDVQNFLLELLEHDIIRIA